jgi:peptide/nickel transport system substrate-binding protein
MTDHPCLHQHIRKGATAFLLLAALATVFAACGSTGGTPKRTGPPQPLIIVPNEGGDLVQNFNPFLPVGAVNSAGQYGPVYETLLFINRANGTTKPWLADSATYSPDATQITFKLHPGIQWSDGQPFTASDVAFTFNTIMKYSSDSDANGITAYIKSVVAVDPQTVTMTLTSANSSILWLVGGQTFIVAQHIWSSVGDPSKYVDKVPVGTGPYVFKSFTPQLITFTKNPHFWQPGKPIVPEIEYPAYNGNTTAEPAMDTDQTDWNGLFVPNVQKTFIQRDPAHNHYYFAPSDPLMLFLNLKKAPLNQLAVRQAINLALDRNQIATIGESGYDAVSHPTGLILPAAQQFLDPTYANAQLTMNTSQASQILASAGYKAGSDGIMVGPDGKKLSFTAEGVTGYTDWDTDYQIITHDLKQIGIQVNVTDHDPGAAFADLQSGNFDMAIYYGTPGPTPYYIYNQVLASSNTAPIGQTATSNYERWSDPATDALLNQYTSTANLAQQQQAMYGIEKIVVAQLPVIFLVNEPWWYEYNTLKYVGWPTQSNPYAEASPFAYPDDEIVLLNLHQ